MTGQNAEIQDIFKGSEKVEIFGKLPAFLWGFLDSGKQLVQDIQNQSDHSASLDNLSKILGILNSAADHLNNNDLRDRLGNYGQMLEKLRTGSISPADFTQSFPSLLKKLEPLAGPRRENSQDFGLDLLDKELEKAEKIKTGRSADIIVSHEIMDDVRNYLSKEVLTEGISSVLLIDNAGTLIVNIGDKIELDVVGLAAVAAANFAATEQIARLIGESDFVLLFYKGHSESFHFSRVGTEYIIVTIFDNSLSLGLLRLKITEVARVLEKKLPKREV